MYLWYVILHTIEGLSKLKKKIQLKALETFN